jgi:hypothetical protein
MSMYDSDLTPEFTTRIRFRFAEVLPADDPVAQWVVNLARGLNDLMLANARRTRRGVHS